MTSKHPGCNCEECPLREVGRYVEPAGPEKASLAFVGEAPNVQEARAGVPFIGPSGKLLRIVMDHHGIPEDDVLFTNAVLCRAPDGSTPPKSAVVCCRPGVHNDLESRGVRTVVALGNTAAESLLGRSGVTKLRVGPAKRGPYLVDVDVIPTLHPAACLRQADQFPNMVQDIGKVKNVAPVFIEPTYIVAEDVHRAIDLLDAIDERLESGQCVHNPEKVLVIDIEVDIEKDTAFDHPNQYGMLCVGIGYDRSKVLVLAEGVMGSQQVRDRLGSLLRKYRIVAQNGKFDLAGLYPVLGPLTLWFDTMLASYTFDERPGIHGLKYMAVEYLGAPQYDQEIKKYVGPKTGYGAIPRHLLYKYNATDVACTYSLYEMWSERFADLEGQRLREVHDFLVAASNELMFVELNGIAVDRTYLRELDIKYKESLANMEVELDRIVRGRNYDKRGGINPRSPMQVKAYLKDKGINVDSTNEATLELIKRRSSLPQDEEEVRAFIDKLLEHRAETKLHGTYVKGIDKRLYGGRVFPTFLLHGTTTGRLSCRNPNMQNIPRGSGIRKMFVPAKEGRVFVQTDYSQAELRVLSFLARDKYFRDIFNDGTIDLFDDLTPRLYPDNPGKELTSKEAWKELRIRVKAYVYGVSYGREEFSIATEYDIPVAEAKRGMKAFFDVIPEIVEFREQTRQAVTRGEELVTPRGRHRRYELITKENYNSIMNEALAFLPQSTASDMCLDAFVHIRQETKGFAWVRNLIHDAVLTECAEEDAEEVKAIQEKHMLAAAERIVGDYVKFAVETTIGKSWGEL